MTQGRSNPGLPFIVCPQDFHLFHKKEKMDFRKYKFKMNVKSCCLYEQITGKNFLTLSEDDDVLELVYCCLVTNNPDLLMTYQVFLTFMDDKKVSQWIAKMYERIGSFNAQIKHKEAVLQDGEKKESDEPAEPLTMTDIASALIVRHGVDAHYVMYEMDLWEIEPYLVAADIQRKNDLVTQRFWTYLTISPNINTKKVRSPEELVPFEWEKKKESVQKRLDENTAAAVAFLTRNNKKEETENGEG